MEEKTNKKRIKEWVYLSLSVLTTAFIIVHSSLSGSESAKWSGFLTRILTSLFNGSGSRDIIEVKGVDISYPKDYVYNNLEGYKDNELPIGVSKRIDAVISPSDASNTAISYTISDNTLVNVKQDKNNLYVTANSLGNVDITVYSRSNPTLSNTYHFDVVPLKAPTHYAVSDLEVYEESSFYLPISYDNYECYDVNELDIVNPHKDVVDVSTSNPRMYYASSVGVSTLSIGEKSFTITVKSKSSRVLPEFKGIFGDESIISNSSSKYEVEFVNDPTSKGVTWEISDPSLASISKEGEVTVKDILADKEVTITARSVLDDKLFISKKILLKKEVVTTLTLMIPNSDTDIADSVYMGEVGSEIKARIMDEDGNVYKSSFTVKSNDDSIAKAYIQGSYLYITSLKEGNTRIVISSVNNPEVTRFIDLQVVASGVINPDNYQSFYKFIRKSLGHFTLFLIDGVFTFLYFYELDKHITFKYKKKWHYIAISAGWGLFLAGISELIQHFIPSRIGSFIDIGIDFLGYLLGLGITLLIIYLIKKRKKKDEDRREISD